MSTAKETPRSILLSTDFRSESDGSLDAVAKLALAFESKGSVLHVMQNISLAIEQSYRGKDDTLLMQPALRSLAEKHVPVAQSSWLAATAETVDMLDAALVQVQTSECCPTAPVMQRDKQVGLLTAEKVHESLLFAAALGEHRTQKVALIS